MSNPYQPPNSNSVETTWWQWLRNCMRWPKVFRAGDPIIWCGVAFFVYPDEPSVLYAALPSSKVDEERMTALCNEAQRILPDFLHGHPKLHSLLRGRSMVVRMIDVYERIDEDKCNPVELHGAVDAALQRITSSPS